ncbi:hypothetical protein CYY_000721 [Polysphondylium violaceum]|uniref:Phosphatidic acid phosphatase type 2/haloperoxidase domain-containing protein n=1 Tax=Polysphondylium violaceum TaxID=133409 RepID=A0A8J4Q4A5_9MYCE|nr:hypothetical protein CYY_000721 [Polysphondylium violaceum]
MNTQTKHKNFCSSNNNIDIKDNHSSFLQFKLDQQNNSNSSRSSGRERSSSNSNIGDNYNNYYSNNNNNNNNDQLFDFTTDSIGFSNNSNSNSNSNNNNNIISRSSSLHKFEIEESIVGQYSVQDTLPAVPSPAGSTHSYSSTSSDNTLSLPTINSTLSGNGQTNNHYSKQSDPELASLMTPIEEYNEEYDDGTTIFAPPPINEEDHLLSNSRDFKSIYDANLSKRPKKRFVYLFPFWLEQKLKWFDDPIIEFCQRIHNRYIYYFSLFITACVAIEIAIAMPFILFILGQDSLATEFTYLGLLLALFSQIPKRFLWRFRPYMVKRAKLMKKDKTSSFPSRAVTCSVVYSYAIVWAVLYHGGGVENGWFRWWFPFLFIGMIGASSFARINLGVHYPSDCVGGVIQGVVVCLLGTGFRKADIVGCRSCWDGGCYAQIESRVLSLHTLDRLNFIMLCVLLALFIVIPIVSVMRPVDFWSKCDRVYGMLFPAVAFQLLMLCPRSYSLNGSLPKPSYPEWYSYLFGFSLAIITTLGASKIKIHSKYSILIFWTLFIVLSVSLFTWRLSLVGFAKVEDHQL